MSSLYELQTDRVAGSGFQIRGIAGENLPNRNLVYMHTDGTWRLADADAAATLPVLGLTMEVATTGDRLRILKQGFIGNTGPWIVGGEIYASSTAGALTQTAPPAPATAQEIGVAIATTFIYFEPTPTSAGGAGAPGRNDFTYLVERDDGTYTVYDKLGVIVHGPGADADVEINWALTNGGAGAVIVLEPNTTFAIDDPITFTANNQWLRGGGRGTFIDGDGLATTEHGIVLSGYTDCIISDLSIQTQDGGGKTCDCIFIEDGSDRFQVRNIWIINSDSSGIHVEGTTIEGGLIEDCHIFAADADGIYIDMDAANYMRRLHITGCDITGCGANGIEGAPSAGNDYWVIEENVIRGCTAYGVFFRDGNHSIIVNNISYNNEWNGIYIVDSNHVTINDNDCYYNGRMGIYIHNSDDCVIEGNQCIENDRDNTGLYDGIYVDGDSDDNLILGNKCNDNDRYGINVAGARNRVKENDFSGNTAGAFNDGGTDTAVHWVWMSVPNPDSAVGQHQGAGMLDGVDTTVGLEFLVPLEFQELVTVQAVVLQIDDAASGNMVWTVATDYGKICTESYIANQDTAGATTVITQFELECLDVSAAFTVGPLAAGDLVGFEFTRDGDAGGDTLDEPCYLLGIRLRYV